MVSLPRDFESRASANSTTPANYVVIILYCFTKIKQFKFNALILFLKSAKLINMEKLVLIDGNSLLNRAYYATPVFSTKNGVPTNAIFGFIKLIFKIMSDVKPEYMVVAFDMKAPTFRHIMFDGYKSTRKPMPEELAVQVEPLKNLLKAMKIATCQKEGIEADDILGTLSKRFNVYSYIYTGDRDSYQLVDEKTEVCFTKRGVSELLHLNSENFEAETGLKPFQIIDLKALEGDKSDNIPGVPGIGAKTAHDLLLNYETLDGVYLHLDEIKGATREKLKNNEEIARLSYKLATIDRNCDLAIDLKDCAVPNKFCGEVKRLFAEFEFKSLLGLDIFEEDEIRCVENVTYPELIECKEYNDIKDILERCHEFSVSLFDGRVEIYVSGKQYTLSLCGEDLLSGDGLDYESYVGVLRKVYSDCGNKVIAYDYKTQLHSLKNFGVSATCKFEDLAVVKYLCDYNSAEENIESLCSNNGYKYEYSAFAVYDLFNKFYEILKSENVLELYEEIEKPLISILFEMESEGIKVSIDGMNELSKYYLGLIDSYKNKIFQACGKTFNINSPMQLGETLYGMGITEVKKKKSDKYSTAAEVLEKLVDKYPVVNDVLKFRLYQKLNSTYIVGFRPLIDKATGLIHTTYHQTLTSTGRLSSSNPNLQNIPVRADEGRELRKIFVAREGNVFIDADYSQIELRLLAHFSECKELIEAYNSGSDIHAATASQVFEVPLESVTPAMRRAAKAVNFGIIYGISEYGLSKNLNISAAKAKEYIDKYFETYSAVKDYMNANVEFAKKNGYVATLTGRKRIIPEIKSSNYNLRQFGERAAMNMPLQGSSADIIKIAMIKVTEKLKSEKLNSKIILQVHDELVLEANESEAEIVAEILKDCMENAVKLKVPLTVEVHSGKTWYDAK